MTEPQILSYSVTLGDLSGDGHNIREVTEIEIRYSGPGTLTEAMIVENYQANVAKLGFGLPELWEEYEQYLPTASQIEKIREVFGFTLFTAYSDKAPKPAEGVPSMEALGDDGPMKLCMILVLSGIEDVEWVEVPTARSLFGGYRSVLTGNESVGYGLKGN